MLMKEREKWVHERERDKWVQKDGLGEKMSVNVSWEETYIVLTTTKCTDIKIFGTILLISIWLIDLIIDRLTKTSTSF